MTTIVAFQGKHGAYSELACRQYFGDDVQTLPCQSFQATFDAIHSQQATHIMLPVENSLAGAVSPAYDLMIDYDLRVQGEEIVKVEHCMMAPAGTKLADVKRAISHWQALAQCAGTLDRLGIEMVNHADTAGSAKELAITKAPNTVALASELSAELYGLEILARDIQDQPNNYTRFFVLGSGDAFTKLSLS